MKTRPTSITIIAWILIVLAGLSLVGSMLMMFNNPASRELMSKNPIPIPIQYAMTYAGVLVTIVSGIGMLKGFNWARWLYVSWGAVGSLVGLVTSPMRLAMIPGIIIFLIVVFLLFRPNVNEFFSSKPSSDNA